MQTCQLTPNIRYVALTDDDGDFGLLLHTFNSQVINVREVHDRDEFTRVYNDMVALSTIHQEEDLPF